MTPCVGPAGRPRQVESLKDAGVPPTLTAAGSQRAMAVLAAASSSADAGGALPSPGAGASGSGAAENGKGGERRSCTRLNPQRVAAASRAEASQR